MYPALDHKGNPVQGSEALEKYKKEYERSINQPVEFWSEKAEQYLTWFHKPTDIMRGSFLNGDIEWFMNGKINAYYNCVERHLSTRGNQVILYCLLFLKKNFISNFIQLFKDCHYLGK